MMQVKSEDVLPGDALTIPGIGMVMVRDTKKIDATEKTRIGHSVITCALGRTDPGFELTFPSLMTLHVHRGN